MNKIEFAASGSAPTTRLAAMPQRMALAIVSVAFISALGLILLAETAPLAKSVTLEHGDADAYFSILYLMRGGSGYYRAAHEILLAQGYGTTSVFNWRTPAWPVLLALFPSIVWAEVLLVALASIAMIVAHRMIRAAQGALLLSIAAILGIIPGLVRIARARGIVFSELATGVLILLSIVSYGNRKWMIGLLAAMAALFIRELAAPYILVCIAFAVCRKNTRELVGWALGLAAYFVYFGWHSLEVMQQFGLAERADGGWIRLGGIRFVLETAHFNGLFFLAPLWLTAVLLPAALLGLFAWRQGIRAALTVTVYLCTFAVVGKPSNFYWGALYTPLLMLGLPWSIPAVYDVLKREPSEHRTFAVDPLAEEHKVS
ncbi:MAG: hypothetical protein ACXWJ5_09190 [Xanthobacteraceae bacterium]